MAGMPRLAFASGVDCSGGEADFASDYIVGPEKLCTRDVSPITGYPHPNKHVAEPRIPSLLCIVNILHDFKEIADPLGQATKPSFYVKKTSTKPPVESGDHSQPHPQLAI
jgi:hypothetical protein